MIERTTPKVKGFDYGNTLPTHIRCNNNFLPETYVSKALDLLRILSDPELEVFQHKLDHSISILPIDQSQLAHFTQQDFKYFGLNDVSADSQTVFAPDSFTQYLKTNQHREPLVTVLSVLAKSAAALLIKRYFSGVPLVWRIYAQTQAGDLTNFDLTKWFGENKPFDKELRVWVGSLPSHNWQVVFAARGILIFLTFVFNERLLALPALRRCTPNASVLRFIGTSLNELRFGHWQVV